MMTSSTPRDVIESFGRVLRAIFLRCGLVSVYVDAGVIISAEERTAIIFLAVPASIPLSHSSLTGYRHILHVVYTL